MLGMMGPVITVAGVALGSALVEKVMEGMGHGDKTQFIKIISWVGCALYVLHYWWDGVQYVIRTFGV